MCCREDNLGMAVMLRNIASWSQATCFDGNSNMHLAHEIQ